MQIYLHRLPTQDSSLIQDSLTDVDFNFGEKVTVNKNNYTLTYSGQGVIGSFMASMVSSAGVMLEPQGNYRLLLLKKYLFFFQKTEVSFRTPTNIQKLSDQFQIDRVFPILTKKPVKIENKSTNAKIKCLLSKY